MVDEVFRRFEVQTGSAAVKSCPADYEIRIGGRLVAVLTSEPVEPGVRPVGAVALFGPAERKAATFGSGRRGCSRRKSLFLRVFEIARPDGTKTARGTACG